MDAKQSPTDVKPGIVYIEASSARLFHGGFESIRSPTVPNAMVSSDTPFVTRIFVVIMRIFTSNWCFQGVFTSRKVSSVSCLSR